LQLVAITRKSPALENGENKPNPLPPTLGVLVLGFAGLGKARLRETFHGKEGVSGSSPEEGSAKAQHVGAFSFGSYCS
jgi:hypothetical protein